jgi:hypothetical protein
MLNNYIDKLSKLTNLSLLTPYNLLENLELDNYLSINYYKQDNCIIADIVFLVYGEEITYRYLFDANNFLQKIYHVDDDELILHFDRSQEKENLITKIEKSSNLKKCI